MGSAPGEGAGEGRQWAQHQKEDSGAGPVRDAKKKSRLASLGKLFVNMYIRMLLTTLCIPLGFNKHLTYNKYMYCVASNKYSEHQALKRRRKTVGSAPAEGAGEGRQWAQHQKEDSGAGTVRDAKKKNSRLASLGKLFVHMYN